MTGLKIKRAAQRLARRNRSSLIKPDLANQNKCIDDIIAHFKRSQTGRFSPGNIAQRIKAGGIVGVNFCNIRGQLQRMLVIFPCCVEFIQLAIGIRDIAIKSRCIRTQPYGAFKRTNCITQFTNGFQGLCVIMLDFGTVGVGDGRTPHAFGSNGLISLTHGNKTGKMHCLCSLWKCARHLATGLLSLRKLACFIQVHRRPEYVAEIRQGMPSPLEYQFIPSPYGPSVNKPRLCHKFLLVAMPNGCIDAIPSCATVNFIFQSLRNSP